MANQENTPKPPLILIASSDDTLKQQLHRWLRKEGYRIAEVSDSNLCIAALRKYRPELLLLDVALPPTNGYLLATQLNRMPHMAKIMMFGPHDDIIAERAFKTGAVEFFSYPLLRHLVINRIQSHLQRAEAKAEKDVDDDSVWYRHLFKAHHEVKLVVDPQTLQVLDANQAAADFYGYTLEQLRSMRVTDITIAPEEHVHEAFQRYIEGETAPARARHRLANGEIRDVEVYTSSIKTDERHLLYAIVHDITDKVHTERALLESEAKYRQLFESASEGIFLVDMETGKIIDANHCGANMLGYTIDEIRQLHYSEIEFPVEDGAQEQETLPNLSAEVRFRCKDGSALFVETNTRVITQNGRVIGLVFVRDASHRKAMEEKMQQQAEFRQALIDTAKIISSTLDVEEVIRLILEQVSRVVPHTAANIMLIDGERAYIAGYHNYDDKHIASIEINIDDVSGLQWMYDTRRPLIIPNTYTSSIWWQHEHNLWIRSYVGAPIIAKGEVIGFMNLDSDKVDTYSEEDSERLMAFANQVAVALENARQASRLENIVKERTQELMEANICLQQEIETRTRIQEAEHEQRLLAEALREAAAALASTLNLEELLQRILEQLAVVLPSDSADIMFTEDGVAAIKAHSGFIPDGVTEQDLFNIRLIVDETANLRWMKEHQKPLAISDVYHYDGWIFASSATWVRSQVGAPLIIGDEVIGFLSLTSRQPNIYNEQHAVRLQAFANQAALALHNARQAAELERRIEERTVALRASEEKYRTLNDQLPLGVYRTTAENKIVHANPALARMLGAQTVEDLLNVNITTFFENPADHKQLRDKLSATYSSTGPHIYQAELQLKTLDGRLIWVRDTANVIFNEQRQIQYVDGTLEDITEQKQSAAALQASREALQAQTESLRTINKIADAIHQSLELETVIHHALEALLPYSEAIAAAILLLNEGKTALHVMDQIGFDEDVLTLGQVLPVDTSLSGLAVQRQDIINSASLKSEPRVYQQLRDMLLERGLRSALIIPILGQNTVLGTINLLYQKPHTVSELEHETFMSIGKTIGLAISNARQMANVRAEMWERKKAEDAERRRRTELEILRQAAMAMNESADLDAILYHIVSYAMKLTKADDAHIYIYDGTKLEFGTAIWDEQRYKEPFSQPREDGITMRVARSGQHIVVNDISTHPLFEDAGWEGAIIGLPLLSNQQVRGVLNVAYYEPHEFTDDEIRALELLADQAASALVNFLYLAEIEHEIQERIRAKEDILRRNEELEMLRRASLEMTATTDINQLSAYIVQYVLGLVHGDYVRLLLVDETGNYALQASRWGQGYAGQDDITASDTVTERVYEAREPVIISDVATADDVNLVWGSASIALPMKVGDTVQGILQVCWAGPHSVASTQLQVLGLLVDHASVALSNVQQIDRIKREVKERELAEAAERDQRRLAEALQHAAAVLNSKRELDELFNEILSLLEDVVPYDGASIMLTDKTGKHASIVLSRGFDDEVAQQSIAAYEEDLETSELYGYAIETGRAYIVEDVQNLAAWSPLEGTEWIRSHVCAPIISEGSAIGFIHLDSREVGRFTQEDADRLLAFANQAAIAIENARMVEELRNYNKHLEQRVNDRTQELNAARARLQAMIASIRDGVIHVSPDGEILYMNPALEDITGYTQDEWQKLGLKLFSLLVPDDNYSEELLAAQPQICQISLEQQGFWRGEFTLKCRDTSLGEVELISTMARGVNGDSEGVVTVVRDISEAQELARQRRQFIANASHELRTPVTNMKTRLFLLKHQPERMEEHLEVMELVVERMQNLIEHLFDITRFEQGMIQLLLQPTDLSQFMKQVIRLQQAEIETHQLHLNVDIQKDNIIATVDAERLEQVLVNLIDNAIAHTSEGGVITLRLRTDDEKFAIIEVEDTGEGIDEELLPNIFQPFFRGEERKNQGAGLGLAIVKDIVEKHGGTVRVQSEVGKGACFIIQLPLSSEFRQMLNPSADEEVLS